METTSKRALVLKLGQIGDVIMALPGVRALHERGYAIDWVCGTAVAPLLSCYSWITVVPTDERAILLGGKLGRVGGIARLWRKIAFRRYQLCATLYYDHRYRFLAGPVRAQQRVMLSRRTRVRTLVQGRHHTDEYARVLLGERDSCRDHSLRPVPPDCLPLSPLPDKSLTRRVAIVPGGVNHLVREQATGLLPQQSLRRWPVELYVSLARLLAERGWEVVLVGSAEDGWVRPFFKGLCVTDCLGTLSLPQVVSLCNASDAMVTHDTGPLHLAGLSDTCLVGIFGPVDPGMRIPRRPYVVGIWGGQGFACRPCYDGRDFAPCTFNGCMHQVKPELVLRELDRLLMDRAARRPSPWRIVVPDEISPALQPPMVSIS